MTTDPRLDILHDHYKETFSRITGMERSRNRLFLFLIGLFALLVIEVGYPIEFDGSLQSLSVLGGQVDLRSFPLAALLSASWVFTFAVGLRYCQTCVAVERLYPYLHHLEEIISPLVGGGRLYTREGREYNTDYPPLLNLAWIAYGFLFPAIILIATISLVAGEWVKLSSPYLHKVFDTVIGAALLIVFYSYLAHPAVLRFRRKLQSASVPSTSMPSKD